MVTSANDTRHPLYPPSEYKTDFYLYEQQKLETTHNIVTGECQSFTYINHLTIQSTGNIQKHQYTFFTT
jgi:hypothetical protein